MNEKYYEALEAIEDKIREHHIKLVVERYHADFYALVLPTRPMIIVNKNKVSNISLPIVLLHEFAHVLLHTDYSYYHRIFGNKAKTEYSANTIASKIAIDILKENGGYIDNFDDSEQLRENLGMPYCFEPNIEKIFKNQGWII